MPHDLIQNARFFYPRDSVDPIVEQLVNELAVVLSVEGKKKQKNILKYLLLDFRQRQIELQNGWIICSRDGNSNVGFYNATEPYASLGVTYDPLVAIMKKLKDSNLIEVKMGFLGESGYMTRIRPTEALLSYLNTIPEDLVRNPCEEAQVIVLKEKYWRTIKGKIVAKKRRIKFDVTEQTRRMADEAKFFNAKLNDCTIDLYNPFQFNPTSEVAPGYEQTQININLNKKYLHRIFNNNFENGGRFYGGWWQNVPSNLRPYILIDETPTVEIDFKGFHIALLYSLEGIDYFAGDASRDPYKVEGWNRDDVKLLLQMVLNCETPAGVVKAYNDERVKEGKAQIPRATLEPLISKFEEMHSPIFSYFYKSWGVILQNIDSLIAANVMRNCLNGIRDWDTPVNLADNFIALCVHDSFIVKEPHKGQLIYAMKLALVDAIMEVEFYAGENYSLGEMRQYTPILKSSNPIDLNMLDRDDDFYERIDLHRRGVTLPELKVIRRSNSDGSIERFCTEN